MAQIGQSVVNSVHGALVPLRVTARLVILRLAWRLLVIACISASVAHLVATTFAYFIGIWLRWSAKLVECVREHAAVTLRTQLSCSFRGNTQLVSFMGATEIAVRGDHAGLVEHLELSTSFFVSDTLHEGLWAAKWTPLFSLFSQSSQFTSQINCLVFGRHSLLWSAFAVKFQLNVARVRWPLVGVVWEAHWIHQTLVVSRTCSCWLCWCQIFWKSLSRIKVGIVHFLWYFASLLVNVKVIGGHVHITDRNQRSTHINSNCAAFISVVILVAVRNVACIIVADIADICRGSRCSLQVLDTLSKFATWIRRLLLRLTLMS